ncbi:hypothetical protein [Microbacterium rhizophilus]|uniref:hypothetical protein n=1 Tax=Microbacterium rhizophilus TaxID=3138934 RepID=UPI0031E980A8
MKTSTIAALGAVLAVAAIGGGTAYALNQPEPVETPAAVATETPAPAETTPAPEATDTTEPAASAGPSAEPVETTPAPTYSAAEAELIRVTRVGDLRDLAVSDEQILAAAQTACEVSAAADYAASGDLPGATTEQAAQFWSNARAHLCP